MASSQGPTSAADRAAGAARWLEQSWIGTEHVLLALFDEPGPATEALEELGVTRELVEESARGYSRRDPPPPPYDPKKGLSPNPAWYKMTGCAKGLALASGRHPGRPGMEFNWLGDPEAGGPRRAWVGGEEDVDLDAALATARDRAGAGD